MFDSDPMVACSPTTSYYNPLREIEKHALIMDNDDNEDNDGRTPDQFVFSDNFGGIL